MKITKTQLKQIIKEEIEKVIKEASTITPELEKEILKMLDAGKEAAYDALGDRREAIEQAGEYVDDVKRVKELYPNAYAWWNENYGSFDANDMIDHWMAKRRYSMR